MSQWFNWSSNKKKNNKVQSEVSPKPSKQRWRQFTNVERSRSITFKWILTICADIERNAKVFSSKGSKWKFWMPYLWLIQVRNRAYHCSSKKAFQASMADQSLSKKLSWERQNDFRSLPFYSYSETFFWIRDPLSRTSLKVEILPSNILLSVMSY